MEHRQLLKVDDVVAVLGVALGKDGHTACDDAARLFHELLDSGKGLAGGDNVVDDKDALAAYELGIGFIEVEMLPS